jgi:RHS repeat-associated protein
MSRAVRTDILDFGERTFTGREYDSETGLYYYRARYDDVLVGRFTQEDPLRVGGGTNLYAYAANNVANLVDPTGLSPVSFGNCLQRCVTDALSPIGSPSEVTVGLSVLTGLTNAVNEAVPGMPVFTAGGVGVAWGTAQIASTVGASAGTAAGIGTVAGVVATGVGLAAAIGAAAVAGYSIGSVGYCGAACAGNNCFSHPLGF